jgi:metallo-beta-lactamase family protein
LVVSWQAPHTLGRRMLEKQEQIKIFGEVFERKIDVQRIAGFSAHAGQGLLSDYALAVKDRAKEVFLVHGEPVSANNLQEVLKEQGMDNLHYPKRGSTFEI